MHTPFLSREFDKIVEAAVAENSKASMEFVNKIKEQTQIYELIQATRDNHPFTYQTSYSLQNQTRESLNQIESDVIELLKNEAVRQGKPLQEADLPARYRAKHQEATQPVMVNRGLKV